MIGTGFHGRRVARLVSELGGEVVAAVSAADEIGKTIESVTIGDDVATELDRVGGADVAIVIVPGPPQLEEQLVGPCLDRGVNVVTLSTETFSPSPEWAEAIHQRALAGGASILATGAQDLSWVHVPANAAAYVKALTSITIECTVDIGQLSAGVAFAMELGGAADRFPDVHGRLSAGAPILGGGLMALARRLELGAAELEVELEPIVAEQPLRHSGAGVEIPPGTLAGVRELTRITTESGVSLRGDLASRVLPENGQMGNTVLIEGDPPVRLQDVPFPGTRVTDVATVARIPDVLAAPPGLLDVATLPAPRYRPSLI